jgi:hypothetical protein
MMAEPSLKINEGFYQPPSLCDQEMIKQKENSSGNSHRFFK